jgi:MFS family permease
VKDHPEDPAYARYALFVLVLVYVFNFLDRQIPAILAERIKADLHVSDAQLGYLYGTAFAVFYAIFGIPLGRLADAWDRRRLIAIGLAFWSLMTAASGFARSFPQLALARIGVGVGEASATPAAYSLLSDYFPRHRRATVLGIYSSGIYIGVGLGLFVGGVIVDRWEQAFGAAAPLGLRGWQAAFLIVGLPGLLLAGWVATLREPVRGASEGFAAARIETRPWRAFLDELLSVLPPFTLLTLARVGAGRPAIFWNLGVIALLCGAAALLTRLVGTPAQWIALAIGVYAVISWAQALACRDRPAAALLFEAKSLGRAALGFAFLAFSGYALSFWLPSVLVRFHGLPIDRVGFLAGGTAAAGGFVGVTLGGLLADRWRRVTPNGRLYVGLLNAGLAIPLGLATFWAHDVPTFALCAFALHASSALWLGPAASTFQDLVLPRLRALSSAACLLVITLVGLALGPYTVGRLSMATGDLRMALSLGLLSNLAAAVCLLLARRTLAQDEAARFERARAAGEPDAAPTAAVP